MKHSSAATILLTLGVLAVGGRGRHATANATADADAVIHVTAKKFEYAPSEITLRKDVPVVLEITAVDRDHGFKVPELGIRADLKPGETTRVRIVPDRVGRFAFRCDVFCGSGHDDMAGELIVVE